MPWPLMKVWEGMHKLKSYGVIEYGRYYLLCNDQSAHNLKIVIHESTYKHVIYVTDGFCAILEYSSASYDSH